MSYRKDIQLICYDQLNIVSERDEKNKNIWIYNTVYIIHIAWEFTLIMLIIPHLPFHREWIFWVEAIF